MRPVAGARTGTGLWLMQRGTALLLALALPLWIGQFVFAAPQDFMAWRALFAEPRMRVGTLAVAIALALHAAIGMREIFMDYVHPVVLRLLLNATVIVVLALCVLGLAAALWRVT